MIEGRYCVPGFTILATQPQPKIESGLMVRKQA